MQFDKELSLNRIAVIAIDTNVLARLVTNDDPDQDTRAADLLQHNAIFIPKTVILELAWVLRYSYGLGRSVISATLKKNY